MSSSLNTTAPGSDTTISVLKQRYEAAGQDHLFQFWAELTPEEQSELESQLTSINVQRVNRIWKRSVDAEQADAAASTQAEGHDEIRPLPDDAFDSIVASPEKEQEFRQVGLDAIAQGRVGVLLMAGGQGTRLGSTDPKGCYDIGLPSHKSLFQYQAERISSLQALAEKEHGKPTGSVIIPWYVMTSGPTRKATVDFFVRHAYFGLDKANIIFFEQGTLPCLTMDGKILLDSKSHVAVAPDGNGGLYAALRAPLSPSTPNHTVLSDLEARGIIYIHGYCVDNCLVRVADPVFVGYGIAKQADCAAKVVRKTCASESVGVVALREDKFGVIEYSEISKAQSERVDPKTGELAFRAANIANHFYTVDFLKRVESFEDQMAFHIARKKIPHTDLATGQAVKPSKPNGMKLELFVFDVFPFAQHMVVLEVVRKEEFSPLKNAPGTGSDDPDTSRNDLLSQQRRFIEAAGATLANDDVVIEVSPLVSYAGEGLEAIKGKTFTRSGIVESIESFDALV